MKHLRQQYNRYIAYLYLMHPNSRIKILCIYKYKCRFYTCTNSYFTRCKTLIVGRLIYIWTDDNTRWAFRTIVSKFSFEKKFKRFRENTIGTMAKVLFLLLVTLLSVYMTEQAYFLQEDFIEKINEKVTTWKVRYYYTHCK